MNRINAIAVGTAFALAAFVGSMSVACSPANTSKDPYNESTSDMGGTSGKLQIQWRQIGHTIERGKDFTIAVELHNLGSNEEVVFFPGIQVLPSFYGKIGRPEKADEFGPPFAMGRREMPDKDFVRLLPGDFIGCVFDIPVPRDERQVGMRLTIWYENKSNKDGAWVGQIGIVNSPDIVIGR
jgi:hypothetical protein